MKPSYIVQEGQEKVRRSIAQILVDAGTGSTAKEHFFMVEDMRRMLDRKLGRAFNEQLKPEDQARLEKIFTEAGQRNFELALIHYFPFAPPRYGAVLDAALKELRANFVKEDPA